MNPDKILELARHSLACYSIANYAPFELAPHLAIIAAKLEALAKGQLKRLILCMPPRHGKSRLTTILFPAWYLGLWPDRQVISASYGQELADDFGREVRNLIASPRHQAIFPGCRLSDDSSASRRFATRLGGTYYAVGRGAATTGRGAHLLLIDDPLKDRDEANSEAIRRSLKDWFSQVAYTRLMPGGAVVIVGNRWHEDDLAGWLLREHAAEGWNLISLPAIAEEDEPFRREGEALWPQRYPLADLLMMKLQLGGAAWASLYQQRPAAAEGTIFKREWWRFFQSPVRIHWVLQSWDTGYKTGAENDYSACTTWGVGDDGYYLLHAWRGRLEFPDLKKKVAELSRIWQAPPRIILIEDRASGQSIVQELKRDSRLPILPIRVDSDKISRAQAVTPLVEAGKVFLRESASWREEFLDELSAFPFGHHDDYVDSAVQALNYLSTHRYYGGDAELWAACATVSLREPWDDPYVRANMVELPDFFTRRRW